MNVPDFYFVDGVGNRLPSEEEVGVQRLRQFASRWRVHVDGEWAGQVAIEGDPPILLTPINGNEWEPSPTAGSDRLKGAVGSLSAVLLDSSGQDTVGARRVLQIQPANISWDELEQIIEDIGLLALLSASCTQVNLWTPVQEDIGLTGVGIPLGIGRGPLQTASSLIALYETIQGVWPVIQQRPLKSIVSKLGTIRMDKVRSSPALMIKRKMEPYRTAAAGIVIDESADCSENKFLAYLLDHYLISLAKGVIALLESVQKQLDQARLVAKPLSPSTRKAKLRAFTERARQRADELHPQYEAYKRNVALRISQLETVVKWASTARNSDFLVPVITPVQLPAASLRLTHSPHYGPVYAKFIECQTTSIGGLERVLYLLESIQKHCIRPAWNLYELWCVAKIYTTIMTDLQLRPPKGERSLFERAEFAGGELRLPTNTPFRLIGRFGDRNVEAEIWYEKEYLSHHTHGRLIANPDIVVDIKVDGSSSQFCFDAKYRNYTSQGIETFVDDVYTRAYQKYQQQFRFQCGFILHTDRTADYWGEVKIDDFLRNRFQSETPPTTDYAKHRYGAVALRPGFDADRQLRKLKQLIFQYHGPLRDTCLNCGYRLKPVDDMQHDWGNDPKKYNLSDEDVVLDVINDRRDRKGTGIYCSCPKCGNFWVIQRCKGANHLLLKTDFNNCLHRPSSRPENKGKWMYICPICGSDPSFADYASTTSIGREDAWYPEDSDIPHFLPPDWFE